VNRRLTAAAGVALQPASDSATDADMEDVGQHNLSSEAAAYAPRPNTARRAAVLC